MKVRLWAYSDNCAYSNDFTLLAAMSASSLPQGVLPHSTYILAAAIANNAAITTQKP